jgi:ParB-like nuclease domain
MIETSKNLPLPKSRGRPRKDGTPAQARKPRSEWAKPVRRPMPINSTSNKAIKYLRISDIEIGARRRALDQARVELLAQSLQELGLQTPITVGVAEGMATRLIAGYHRIEAAKLLGWLKISCFLVKMDELTRGLWEIDENLCRVELTELERGEHLAARKQIYEQLHPETRQYVSGALAANAAMGRENAEANLSAASFAVDTAAKTGLDERTIRRSIHRAEKIVSDVRDTIRHMPEIADKGVELDALAKLPPALQAVVVAKVKTGDAPDIRAAAASSARNDEAEPAARKELTSNTATVEPPARRTMAQKWARHLADQMSVSELREVRDAINEILATAEHGGPDTVHLDEAH